MSYLEMEQTISHQQMEIEDLYQKLAILQEQVDIAIPKAAFTELQQQLAEKDAEIEKLKGKKNVGLADDSSDREPKQQRHLAGSLEMGQLLERGQDTTAGNSKSEGVITLKGVDEYGPLLEWKTHWVDFPVGAEFFSEQQLAEKEAEIERLKTENRDACIGLNDYFGQQLVTAQAREQKLLKILGDAKPLVQDWCNENGGAGVNVFVAVREALVLPQDTTALQAYVTKAGEVMRERCARELFPDVTRRMEEPFRTIPGVTMEDLK